MITEQTRKRQRQSHKPPAGIYHALGDQVGMQENIARVTLEHLRQGKRVDFRNLAVTYPHAFQLVYDALDAVERIDYGLACNEVRLRAQVLQREHDRYEELRTMGSAYCDVCEMDPYQYNWNGFKLCESCYNTADDIHREAMPF